MAVSHEGQNLHIKGNNDPSLQEAVFNYFGLDDDLDSILRSVAKDTSVKEAVRSWHGLRLVRQESWECLVTYLCSIYSNIGKIELNLNLLRQRFGRRVLLADTEIRLFPKPTALCNAPLIALQECALGFRAKYVKEVANRVAKNPHSLEAIRMLQYDDAFKALTGGDKGLKRFPGVGSKVADCVLLFSMGKHEAFPIDVWIRRAVSSQYHHLFKGKEKLVKRLERGQMAESDYKLVSKTMRDYFGPYAGYAQEYLFYHARSVKASRRTPERQGQLPGSQPSS